MSDSAAQVPIESQVDPITFEVIRHKLMAINVEQATTIRSVSGSSIVTDIADFNTGIYGPYGEVVAMGWHVGWKAGCMSGMIRNLVDNYKHNIGINEGDMFCLNDPYFGALHQADVAMLAPIYWGGRLIAWTGADCHEVDVGGTAFGSLQLGARDVQGEGMLLPGVKLVEKGKIREDIWLMIMGMVRIPPMVALDLKAMIAANNVAIRRMGELFDHYGAETVEAVMRTEMAATERQFRARLRSLPDGVFRAVSYFEHDGHEDKVYKVALSLEKRGERLMVDMAGSSPQAPGCVNCAKNGLRGALFAGSLPIIAPDMRWNEGIFKILEFHAPEGSVVNSLRPAPVSASTTNAMFQVMQAMEAAASRLVACLNETSRYASAPAKGPFCGIILNGTNRDGYPYGDVLGDSMAGGGGAYVDHDGLDPAVDYCVPQPVIGNIEAYEARAPILVLYRSLVRDGGGAGRSRGGVGIEFAVTPHDTPGLNVLLVGSGLGTPEIGIAGGLAASSAYYYYVEHGSDAASPLGRIKNTASLDAAGGIVHKLGPKNPAFWVKAGDVIVHVTSGGGGYGDPLDREPERVRVDVVNGLVSAEAAAQYYGVIIAGDAVDEDATAARRAGIRKARLGGTTPNREAVTGEANSLGALRLDDNRNFSCRCGHPLGSARENWKTYAAMRVVDSREHGPLVHVRDELELHEYICPSCATLLETELMVKGEPSLHTIELL